MSPKLKLILKIAITYIILFIILEVLMVKFNLRERIFKSSLFSEDYRYLSFFVPIGISILTSWIGYFIARKNNRNKVKWTLLCFLLNVWGVAILFFLTSQVREKEVYK